MVRHFRCKNLAHAHMIRSFLLDHEIEAHVLHENAGHLWAGAVADCVLAVHETDLGFLNEAFSAPRETVTAESEFPESEFDEQDSAPLRFGSNYFLSVVLTGVAFVWVFFLSGVMLNALSEKMTVWEPGTIPYRQPIELADLVAATCIGLAGGLLTAVAIIAARHLSPDERGRFSINARCFIFLIYLFTCDPVIPIVWVVRAAFA